MDYATVSSFIKTAKPRCSAEWRARFAHWQKPPSDTEEQKIESAKRQIGYALDKCEWLTAHTYRIIKQGSYENNTNVRADSDVDLCVCLNHAITPQSSVGESLSLPELGLYPLDFSYDTFRGHVVSALQSKFGYPAVKVGKKSIKIHTNDDNKISADVVPAFKYWMYPARARWQSQPPSPIAAEGVAIYDHLGNLIFNFPEQHLANGRDKNTRTGRRYKRVVRIMKRLRNYMKDNFELFDEVSSFLIECMVYNCPDDNFAGADLYDDLRAVLHSLKFGLLDETQVRRCREVNGIKPLFSPTQGWTADAALSFANKAYDYVGFGV